MPLSFAISPNAAAAQTIRDKPALIADVFQQLLPELRGRAFTISGVESLHALETIRDEIATLPEGALWDDVKANVADSLDPWLGDQADRRATLLLRTHGFQAYQAQQWAEGMQNPDATHWQYLCMEDSHVRETHYALNGLILPKDDEFWLKHFPPWEWGCRCRCRSMNPDQVDIQRLADQAANPEDHLVIEGPALDKLRDGDLVRGPMTMPDGKKLPGRAWNITPPSDRGQSGAYLWNPSTLRIPLSQLESTYTPEEWKVFREFAQSQEISPGQTVWDWLSQPLVP